MDSLGLEAVPQVGHTAVDEVFGLLGGPAQELADLGDAVALEVQRHGVAAGGTIVPMQSRMARPASRPAVARSGSGSGAAR